jgi:hypothetical protein
MKNYLDPHTINKLKYEFKSFLFNFCGFSKCQPLV